MEQAAGGTVVVEGAVVVGAAVVAGAAVVVGAAVVAEGKQSSTLSLVPHPLTSALALGHGKVAKPVSFVPGQHWSPAQ